MRANPDVAATTGTAFSYDAGAAFSGSNISYTVTFAPAANGLSATGAVITGTPTAPGETQVAIAAHNALGVTVADTFTILAFAPGLASPALPAASYQYADAEIALPALFTTPTGPGGGIAPTDNTPADNPVTDAGATLGRCTSTIRACRPTTAKRVRRATCRPSASPTRRASATASRAA